MKVSRIETRIIEYPTPGVFRPAWTPGGNKVGHGFTFLKIVTDSGLEGYSTGLRYRVFEDSKRTQMEKGGLGGIDAQRAVQKYLETMLLGYDPFKIEPLIKVLQNASFFGKGRFWFVEMALWDIIGKAAGLPVYRLLGGSQERIKAYGSWGELKSPERAHADAKTYAALGYKALKVRIHSDSIDEDVEQVKAVRQAVGDAVEIMVDANQARVVNLNYTQPEWDLKRAIQTARRLEELNVRWLEEPMKQWDAAGLAELRAKTSVPIAGGEYDENIFGFLPIIDAFDILQPDIVRAGGMLGTRKIGILAEARNKLCEIHSWGDGLLMHPSVQLAASMPNCPYIELPDERPNWAPEVRDILLKNPVVIDPDGYVTVPQSSGMGFELDWAVIDKYTVKA
jgi:D-galactarolactone cycloisomerase